MKRVYVVAALMSVFQVTALPAIAGNVAEGSAWVIDQYSKSRLFVGSYDAEAKVLHLGWQVTLKEGWKTYWRSPGEAGLPPRWAWGNAENIENIAVKWPAPKRKTIFGMETFIYAHEVILPIEVAIADGNAPVTLALDLEYMICAEICIPQSGTYHLQIAVPGEIEQSLFQRAQLGHYQALVPVKVKSDGVRVTVRELADTSLQIFLPPFFDAVKDIIIEGPEDVLFGQMRAAAEPYIYAVPYMAKDSLAGKSLTLTILSDEGTAHEMAVTVQP